MATIIFPHSQSSSILSTSRYLVHFNNTVEETYSPTRHTSTLYPTRLLVARDPLGRILSSNLDKMYLLDFWHRLGKHFTRRVRLVKSWASTPRFLGVNLIDYKPTHLIAKIIAKYRDKMDTDPGKPTQVNGSDFLTLHFKNIYRKFDSAGSPYSGPADKHLCFSLRQLTCEKYLTFDEFVSVSISDPEVHWEPTHTMCNPCQFQPTHVSLMSTFSSDAKVILSVMGHEHAIDEFDLTAQVG